MIGANNIITVLIMLLYEKLMLNHIWYGRINMNKDLIEDKLHQLIDQFNETMVMR